MKIKESLVEGRKNWHIIKTFLAPEWIDSHGRMNQATE